MRGGVERGAGVFHALEERVSMIDSGYVRGSPFRPCRGPVALGASF